MRCSVWHRCIHAPVPAEWSGMDRAALGSSVMLRAKPGTKQGWQCMFFPTQCPGTLPLLMNTLSSFCSELILLWILCTFQFFCCSCASSSVDFLVRISAFLLSVTLWILISVLPEFLYPSPSFSHCLCFTWWVLSLAAGDEKHLCSMKHASAHQCRVGKHLVQPKPCDQPL